MSWFYLKSKNFQHTFRKKATMATLHCHNIDKLKLCCLVAGVTMVIILTVNSTSKVEESEPLLSEDINAEAFFDYSEFRTFGAGHQQEEKKENKEAVDRVFTNELLKGKRKVVFKPGEANGGQYGDGVKQPVCPVVPPYLVGRQNVSLSSSESETDALVDRTHVTMGGRWSPSHCTPRYKVAIIVPYRDREEQVWSFLSHMHKFLQKQELSYVIIIVEQSGFELFNRAKLLNVGYVEASKHDTFNCVVFHDVDMLPEDDRHLYHCTPMPRHLVVASSNNKYRSSLSFQRDRYFGGACMMTPKIFRLVNGWANRYWGWGGEDDDMWRRVSLHDLPVWRYPAAIARYTMIPHGTPPGVNKHSYEDLARFSPEHRIDGLNSLTYDVVKTTEYRHHTRILVDVGKPEPKDKDKTQKKL